MEKQMWEKVTSSNSERERLYSKSRSFAQDVWLRFRKKPTSLIGFILAVSLLLFAIIGPFLSPYTYSEQNNKMANLPPSMDVFPVFEDAYFYITPGMKVIEVTPKGELVSRLKTGKMDRDAKEIVFDYKDGTVTLDYSEKPVAMLDQNGERMTDTVHVRNRSYLLGTDDLGRDILTRLMFGTRISMLIAFIAATVNLIIGTIYGGISGFAGGRTDAFMMRVVDVISTIPLTLYVILIKVSLDNGLVSMIVALSSVYWVDMARMVRGQVLTLKQQDFVLAAKTIGSSNKSILFKHLLPNAMGPILVTVTMLIPSAIFMEAFMSFIGIGIAPPMASLGTMCNDATAVLRTSPYQLFLPALIICLIMFAFNFIGDGLRDALDPKLKK